MLTKDDLKNTKMSSFELRLTFWGQKDGKYPELKKKDLCYVYELQNEVVGKRFKKTGTCFADWLAATTDDATDECSLGTNDDPGDF